MNYFKIWGLVLFTVLCINTESMATDCTPTPDCATLGYTKTESECTGANLVLKCPFDDSKVACSSVSLPKYEPEVGYILYSDKSVSPTDKYEEFVAAGKKPIGVVFDADNRLALALTELYTNFGKDLAKIPNVEYCNVKVYNVNVCKTPGKQNTEAIITYAKENGVSYPAVEYCNNYTANDICQNNTWCGAGQWFLPSIRELKILFNNRSSVNNGLLKTKAGLVAQAFYWSSTGFSEGLIWDLDMMDGTARYADHTGLQITRPVLAF